VCVQEVALSRSSIQRARSANRSRTASDAKSAFNPTAPLIVHWDGKLLPDVTGHEKVDRLPVIVTGTDTDRLLGVPKLASGTGQAQADAVVDCLKEWNISQKVRGLCFDTTSSNTGRLNGASCILIERGLDKNLLHFVCHHHVLEIVLEKVFTALKVTAASSGPEFLFYSCRNGENCTLHRANFAVCSGKPESLSTVR